MKYVLSKENMNLLLEVSTIMGEAKKDTKGILTIGATVWNNKLLCLYSIPTERDQSDVQFLMDMPEGFEQGSRLVISVNNQNKDSGQNDFVTILRAMLSFNEDAYIDIDNNNVSIGVSTKAKAQLLCLSEAPMELVMGQPLTAFSAKSKDMRTFISKSSIYTGGSGSTLNACWTLDTTTGIIRGFSTDCYTMSKSKVSVEMAKATGNEAFDAELKKSEEAFEEYLKSNPMQKKDNFMLIIPDISRDRLSKFLGASDVCMMQTDGKHIFVQINNSIAYTFVMGATAISEDNINGVLAMQEAVSVGFDNYAFMKAVEFISILTASSSHDPKIMISVGEKETQLSFVGLDVSTKVKNMDFAGQEAEICVNLSFLKKIISSLSKGGIVIRIIDGRNKVAKFYNGTVAEVDETSAIALLGINVSSVDDAEENESSDEE